MTVISRVNFDAIAKALGYVKKSAVMAGATRTPLPEIYINFDGKRDGPAPFKTDTGEDMEIFQFSSGSAGYKQVLKDGVLVNNPGTNVNTDASYWRGTAKDIVKRIGARFCFKPGTTTGGAMCIAITNAQLTNAQGVANMSVHFLTSPTAWAYGVWDNANGGFVVLANGAYDLPLAIDGVTEYEMEAWIVGNTAYLDTPDGVRTVVTDARIGNDTSFGGKNFFFESFANNGTTDNTVAYSRCWASTGKQRVPAPKPFRPWRRIVVVPQGTVAQPTIPANTSYNIPNQANPLVTVPPSGSITVRVQATIKIVTEPATFFIALAYSGGASGSIASTQDTKATGAQGRVYTAQFVLSGLPPGKQIGLYPQIYLSSSDAVLIQAPGSGYYGSMIAEPIY